MAKIAWVFRVQPDPQQEYVVAYTRGLGVTWHNWPKIWLFQQYTRRIVDQLNQSAGCVGYALRATFRPIEGATLSVWAEPEALRHFYKAHPHKEAMQVLSADTQGRFQYVQWQCPGATLPHAWEEAEEHLQTRGPAA